MQLITEYKLTEKSQFIYWLHKKVTVVWKVYECLIRHTLWIMTRLPCWGSLELCDEKRGTYFWYKHPKKDDYCHRQPLCSFGANKTNEEYDEQGRSYWDYQLLQETQCQLERLAARTRDSSMEILWCQAQMCIEMWKVPRCVSIVDSVSGQFSPKSLMGRVLRYTYPLLPRLSRYVLDGRYSIDNNGVENAIRPLAIGRKDYLFCWNHDVAVRAVIV